MEYEEYELTITNVVLLALWDDNNSGLDPINHLLKEGFLLTNLL